MSTAWSSKRKSSKSTELPRPSNTSISSSLSPCAPSVTSMRQMAVSSSPSRNLNSLICVAIPAALPSHATTDSKASRRSRAFRSESSLARLKLTCSAGYAPREPSMTTSAWSNARKGIVTTQRIAESAPSAVGNTCAGNLLFPAIAYAESPSRRSFPESRTSR